MARPIKEGLDYLPLDVDFFENPKIEAISDEFGCAGECIILRLFCRIYDNGAFIKCDALLTRPISKRTGTSIETVTAVIDRAVEYGIFDRDKYEQYGVLTSKGIQDRYFFAKKKWQYAEIPDEFLLTEKPGKEPKKEFFCKKPSEDDSFCENNSENEGDFLQITRQRKEKKSKEKESKVNSAVAELKTREREEAAAAEAELFLDTETYSEIVTDLANETALRFGQTMAMPHQRRKMQELLNAIHIRGQDTPGLVREALQKLDKAEAITSGRMKFGIDQFLNPDLFLKLLHGNYDDCRKRDKKTTPDLGVSFSELAKKGLYDHD